jgi:TonB family protein
LAVLLACTFLSGCSGEEEPIEHPAAMPGPTPFAYPVELWDRRIEGETMLMVHVTELGAVDSAYVLTSSGHAEFDSAAMRGAPQLRFSPGKQGKRRVPMWTRLPVRFSLDTLQAAAQPASGNHD